MSKFRFRSISLEQMDRISTCTGSFTISAVRSKAVVLLLLTFCLLLLPLLESVICSMFCCMLLYVHSSIAIILMGKTELVALLNCLPGVS